ncbi:hypothetical protein SDC9_147744 [bioreactor metagenome]|uniref:Uncharacterized protein n=1 Tax=bioreactor metagenome TaxID=1076179 RepID=A0A645EEW1_9ZZZZ
MVFFANILPARYLLKYQQAQFIAGVQKGWILGIVTGTHKVHPQALEGASVLNLQGGRSGISQVGVVLMTIQANQINHLSIEKEALRTK